MKLVVVGVFDSAAQAYNRPIFLPSRGVAIRSFMDEVRRKDPDNPLCGHPEDFELRMIAVFDDNTGVFVQDNPEVLMRGKDVERDAP